MRQGSRLQQVGMVATFALGPVGMNLFLPALPDIAASLDQTVAATQSTLSTYLVIYAVVMLLAGPLVDRFGRRPSALCGVTSFAAGAVIGWWAPTLEYLLAGRCLQAIGAGLAGTASRMMVADLNRGEALSRAIGRQTIVMMIGTISSAATGGWLVQWYGWRFTYAVMAVLSTLVLVFAAAVLRETLPDSLASRSVRAIVSASAILARNRVYVVSVAQLCITSALFQVFSSLSPHALEMARGESAGLFSIYLFILYVGFFAGTAVTASSTLVAPTESGRLDYGVHVQLLAALAVFLLALPSEPIISAVFVAFAFVSFAQAIVNPIVFSQAAAASGENASTATGIATFMQLTVAGICVQLAGYLELSNWRALGAVVLAMAAACWLAHRWAVKKQPE